MLLNKIKNSKLHLILRGHISGRVFFLVVASVTIMLLTGFYTLAFRHNTEKRYPNAETKIATKAVLTNQKSQSANVSNGNLDTSIAQPSVAKPVKTFNFVDYSNWTEVSAKNNAYSLKFGPSETHGYCSGDQTTTLLGMVYMNSAGEYDCSSVMTALVTGDPSKTLTRFAIGLSEGIPSDPAPIDVTLVDGISAKRYEYTTTENNKLFNNIEYIASHNGTSYSAHLHWESSYNLYKGSNVTPEYFDTVVQKTWKFN